MDTAKELRAQGLEPALAALQQRVRTDPSNAVHRVFLFQLLCVLGQWERAQTQLGVIGELDPLALPMVQTYREALRCELLRTEVFAGRRTPIVFGQPAEWMALQLEALRGLSAGRLEEARGLRDRAFDAAPAVKGRLELADPAAADAGAVRSEPFEWLADADPRLGPMFEAVVAGRYHWVPFQRVRRVALEAPADLRDLVWTPAVITWETGGETVALLPTRYPGSESSTNDDLRLAARTEWREEEADWWFGLGQRMFATDRGEYALLDVRTIAFDLPEPPHA